MFKEIMIILIKSRFKSEFFFKNLETSAKTTKLNKFLDEIEKHEKSIDEIEALCEQKIKDEQESGNRIDQLREQTNKMENDLRALITEVGEGEYSYNFTILYHFIFVNLKKLSLQLEVYKNN